ncbi:tetratricopeptide repeat protein [Solicola gregarius]|uniref:Tetratricopeptide repeat protein n=1 Tax=Solicola gregarius TaxID=2908642 RepID=A0AA46TLF8_9ACTN|nr:tetratricopeptide repeat protein [Solicola gregarius]UYM07446.1 tetratricopeptide repeat protein [Solicola gregarius]
MDTRALRYDLAQRYFDSRDYRGAIHELTGIVEQSPEDVGVRMLLARSYFHAALLSPAETQLREVIERDPIESYAHHMLARTLERQSRHDEATKHRRIAAALTGDDELLRPHRATATAGGQG